MSHDSVPIPTQDSLLEELCQARKMVTVFMVNGFQLRGYIDGFDAYTMTFNADGIQHMLYKHMISTIALSTSANAPRETLRNKPNGPR